MSTASIRLDGARQALRLAHSPPSSTFALPPARTPLGQRMRDAEAALGHYLEERAALDRTGARQATDADVDQLNRFFADCVSAWDALREAVAALPGARLSSPSLGHRAWFEGDLLRIEGDNPPASPRGS